jgi:hypothetical protein
MARAGHVIPNRRHRGSSTGGNRYNEGKDSLDQRVEREHAIAASAELLRRRVSIGRWIKPEIAAACMRGAWQQVGAGHDRHQYHHRPSPSPSSSPPPSPRPSPCSTG